MTLHQHTHTHIVHMHMHAPRHTHRHRHIHTCKPHTTVIQTHTQTHMYIYTHKHTHTHTHRERDGDICRGTETETWAQRPADMQRRVKAHMGAGVTWRSSRCCRQCFSRLGTHAGGDSLVLMLLSLPAPTCTSGVWIGGHTRTSVCGCDTE